MKRHTITLLLVVLVASIASRIEAQNLQVFYDTERKCVTSTIEMFRSDAFGSTFYFVDMDYSPTALGAYTEIAREFCFWQDSKWNWLSVHAEFNGGLDGAYSFFNNWLGGLTYSGHTADFSKTWSFTASYKAIPGLKDINGKCKMHNFQLTGVWGINFAKGWCSFSGFADLWSEGSTLIFISEPQFWVNLKNIKGWENIPLSIGGEVELANNFAGTPGFVVRPALGAKWTF